AHEEQKSRIIIELKKQEYQNELLKQKQKLFQTIIFELEKKLDELTEPQKQNILKNMYDEITKETKNDDSYKIKTWKKSKLPGEKTLDYVGIIAESKK